jgi:phage terminase small subunit
MAKLQNVNAILPKKPVQINEKQRKLVDTLLSEGCSVEDASKAAGFKGKTPAVQGYQTLKKPHVQEYMYQQIRESFGLHSLKAVNTLKNLSSSAKSEYIKLEASKDILDRAGFKAPDQHQHQILGDFTVNIDLS